MRKIFIGLTTCIVLLMGLISCQDKIDEQFNDPEKTTKESIPKFFTYMLDNGRIRPDYWNVRTFLVMHPALYTQTVSFMNSNRRYQQNFSYIDDFWRDYYTPTGGGAVAQLREIERAYAMLSAEEKANNDVFVWAAKVLYWDQTAQMVDMWGDIPYSQAGSINATRDPNVVLPVFDKAEDIYASILTGLEDAASYFHNTTLNPLASGSFSRQDILMQGSMKGWERYANALRLRALMRISDYNEDKAKADVMEMLASPADYPLVETADQNILLRRLSTYNDNMRNALTEVQSHLAPEYLLNGVFKPADDPRIRVWFDRNAEIIDRDNKIVKWNPTYEPMPTNLASTEQEKNIADGKYAVLDSATFLNNNNFPGIVFTSHEVKFLKAEAFERWGGTGDAETNYNSGVNDAIRFVFYLNQLSLAPGVSPKDSTLFEGRSAMNGNPAIPGEIARYMEESEVKYAGTSNEKLEKIWQQKWIGFGFMQSVQSWAEVRRTNYPVLNFTTDAQNGDFALPGSRLVYPPTEKTYNATNYAAVSNDDKPTTKIFWDVD